MNLPFDVAQGGEPFDAAHGREPAERLVEPFRISTCPPPACLCHAIATASQWPVRYPLRVLNGSGQAGGYSDFEFYQWHLRKSCPLVLPQSRALWARIFTEKHHAYSSKPLDAPKKRPGSAHPDSPAAANVLLLLVYRPHVELIVRIMAEPHDVLAHGRVGNGLEHVNP